MRSGSLTQPDSVDLTRATESTAPQVLHEDQWRQRTDAHHRRVEPWVRARLDRRAHGDKHAVYDFLFDYYPFSPRKLMSWHPGHGVVLLGADAATIYAQDAYRRVTGGVTADIAWLTPRVARLDLAVRLLQGTASRAPITGCFALHEWAMVYGLGQEQVRHSDLRLRVSAREVTDTVHAIGLRCTHVDAYRFYTDQAKPLNATTPTRATQPDEDQPGCLHAAMDCYKLASWFAPLVGSELIADAFELAAMAREVDMRASPYDVSDFGLSPIPVETVDGRRQYLQEQQRVIRAGAGVRAVLLAALLNLKQVHEQATSSR